MLKSIENFLQITKSAVSGIIGILSGYFLRLYLRVDAPDKEIWAVLGVAIVMVFVILFFNWLIEYILERAIWLRRILLRRHFFEGIWIQTIKNDLTTNKPLSNVPHSIVYISYDKGRYKIKGLSYDNEGNHIATFDSHFAEYSYSTNTLEYPFTITTHENTNIKVFGTTQLRFAVTDGMCTNYIGVVSSNIREKPVGVEAIKLKLSKKEKINLNTKEGREIVFKQLVNLKTKTET